VKQEHLQESQKTEGIKRMKMGFHASGSTGGHQLEEGGIAQETLN